MNLMDLFIKIGVDDQASARVGSISNKLGNGLKTAAKIGTAAVATASTAVVGLATSAIKSYAEYEQLVGGVETLFKENASVVQGYAEQAYKTANMSANKYMETVTSFSASLLQGLRGDTAKAAEYADMAVRDMSDNANKFGTDISLIQNAYQGFAKRNYTMLDNLKLGYGGTASEMARLINDSGVLEDTVTVTASNINRVSFDKIVKAIHTVQTEMGIMGTTANEAATTIEGSFKTTEASWQNLLTTIASGSTEDVGKAFDTFAESVETTAKNLEEPVETVLTNIDTLSDTLGAKLLEDGAEWLDAGSGLVTSLLTKMKEALTNEDNEPKIQDFISGLISVITTNGADWIDLGFGIVSAALGHLRDALNDEENKQKISDFISRLAEILTDPDNAILGPLFSAGVDLAEAIIDGLTSVKTVKSLERGIGQFGGTLVAGIVDVLDLINDLLSGFKINFNPFTRTITLDYDLDKLDTTIENIGKGFTEGVLSYMGNNPDKDSLLYALFRDDWEAAHTGPTEEEMNAAKDTMGNNFNKRYSDLSAFEKTQYDQEKARLISSLKGDSLIQALLELDKKYGINGSHKRGLPFVPFDGYIAELHKGERVLTAKEAKRYNQGLNNPTINITINGAQYNSEESLAEAVAYKLQQIINGKGAAYA